MSTKPQRSRQERALKQRTREFTEWSGSEAPQPISERCRNYNGHDDKATKASRDVTALKAKLGKVEA